MSLALTLFSCFFIRVIMYSYRLITGGYIQGDAFVILAYFMSELIPSVICVCIPPRPLSPSLSI